MIYALHQPRNVLECAKQAGYDRKSENSDC